LLLPDSALAQPRNVDWQQQCVAVIPCFNEAAGIARLVNHVKAHLPTVIVVDDGSTDATGAQALASGAEVVRLSRNQGKGAALRTGFEFARAKRFSWALTLDGDGQHSAEDIPAFLACAEQTGADLVIGDRLSTSQGMPWLRRFVNRWMTARLSRLCGRPLADSQCGFRLVRLARWADLPLRTEHFEVESEFLVEFIRAGRRLEFVPVRTLSPTSGSKIKPVADSWRWFRWWLPQRCARRASK
jgi:glycosyltransferase involved in cell wall biosynthesis